MIVSRAHGVLAERMLPCSPETLRAAADGDRAAIDAMALSWGPTVLRWCARLGGPRVDPEDAAHDTFIRILDKLHTLRDPQAFPAWLFQTCRSVISLHRRRAWLRRWAGAVTGDVPDPVDRFARSDLIAAVQAALDQLPAELREVLVLCEVEGRTDSEAALLLGVPVGTAKSRLRRARERFAAEATDLGLAPSTAVVGEDR